MISDIDWKTLINLTADKLRISTENIRCEIDESFPCYIREHQEELSYLIMQEEKEAEKRLRHIKVTCRNACHKVEVGLKRIIKKVIGRG